jgi:hypothetical protein
MNNPFIADLADSLYKPALAVLAEEHAEHRGFAGVDERLFRPLDARISRIGGNEELPAGPSAANLKNKVMFGGLMYFMNARADA